jgi:hypothetical protein
MLNIWDFNVDGRATRHYEVFGVSESIYDDSHVLRLLPAADFTSLSLKTRTKT